MAGRADPVWEHGEKIGSGWKCKYCREPKAGGGATRLKEHLAHRGNDVKDCPSVPKEVKAFFARELDKIKERKRERERQRHRSTAAARTQYVDLEMRTMILNYKLPSINQGRSMSSEKELVHDTRVVVALDRAKRDRSLGC